MSDFIDNPPSQQSVKSTALSDNHYFQNPAAGMKLLANLIMPGDTDDDKFVQLRRFEDMVNKDFLVFEETDLAPQGAHTWSELRKIVDDLSRLILFPELENRITVGVGGQFSAGKSRFLNSFLGCKSLLPVDTSATTSIPTYLIGEKANEIVAMNNYKGKTMIDEESLKAISHGFKSTYGVSFSHMLSAILVRRKDIVYRNLNFLDTPGYSKAEGVRGVYDNTDEGIARDHLCTADALIWLVDIQNGTLPSIDIEFLKIMKFEGPIVVVLNKADNKTPGEIDNILAETRKDIIAAELPVVQVLGYSSKEDKEYGTDGQVLDTFLRELDTQEQGTAVIRRLQSTMNSYGNSHEAEMNYLRTCRQSLNDIVLDDSVIGSSKTALENNSESMKKRIDLLIGRKKDLEKLSKELMACAQMVVRAAGVKISDTEYQYKKMNTTVLTKAPKKYEFPAHLDIRNQDSLRRLPDHQNIPGIVTKVKTSGIYIIVKDMPGIELVVSSINFLNVVGQSAIGFVSEGHEVYIQIRNRKEAVVNLSV